MKSTLTSLSINSPRIFWGLFIFLIFISLVIGLVLQLFFLPNIYSFYIRIELTPAAFVATLIIVFVTFLFGITYLIGKNSIEGEKTRIQQEKDWQEKLVSNSQDWRNKRNNAIRYLRHEIIDRAITVMNQAAFSLTNLQKVSPSEDITKIIDVLSQEYKNQKIYSDDLNKWLVSENLALDLEPVDLSEIMRDQIEAISFTNPNRVIKLNDDVPGGLPKIWADQTAIKGIFQNLLVNACNYSPSETEITISIYADKHFVTILIHDRGYGIPETDESKIFEPLTRGTNVIARKIRGSGLGLATVKNYVEAHNGEIKVSKTESNPDNAKGTGTTIKVELPIQPLGYTN